MIKFIISLARSTKIIITKSLISADKGAACEAVNITDAYGTYELPFAFNGKLVTKECEYDDDDRKAEFLCEPDPLDKSKAYYTPSYGCFKTANTDKFNALADGAKDAVRKNINFLDKFEPFLTYIILNLSL